MEENKEKPENSANEGSAATDPSMSQAEKVRLAKEQIAKANGGNVASSGSSMAQSEKVAVAKVEANLNDGTKPDSSIVSDSLADAGGLERNVKTEKSQADENKQVPDVSANAALTQSKKVAQAKAAMANSGDATNDATQSQAEKTVETKTSTVNSDDDKQQSIPVVIDSTKEIDTSTDGALSQADKVKLAREQVTTGVGDATNDSSLSQSEKVKFSKQQLDKKEEGNTNDSPLSQSEKVAQAKAAIAAKDSEKKEETQTSADTDSGAEEKTEEKTEAIADTESKPDEQKDSDEIAESPEVSEKRDDIKEILSGKKTDTDKDNNKEDSTESSESEEVDEQTQEKKSLLYISIFIVTIILTIFVIFFGVKVFKTPQDIDDIRNEILTKGETEEGYEYNGFAFIYRDNLWHTQLQEENLLYSIHFHYGPREAELVEVLGAFNNNLDTSKFYVTFNPLEENISILALAASELTINLVKAMNVNIIPACSKNETRGCETRPIITCNNTDDAVIFIKFDKETKVTFDDNCITLQGDGMNLLKAVDKLLYRLYGII